MNLIPSIRKGICEICPHQCQPYLSGELDLNDMASSCPISWQGSWHAVATSTAPSPIRSTTTGHSIKSIQIEQGQSAWKWLHEQALKGLITVARLESEFLPMIPQYGCSCKKEWKQILTLIPFRPGDQFLWSVDVHNAINKKLGKPILTIEQAKEIWN